MSYRLLSLCALMLISNIAALAQPPVPSGAKLHPALIDRLEREGRPAKTWVFFTDKGLTSRAALDAALDEVERTYNPRALQRRALRGDNAARGGRLVDEHDIPVCQAYIDAVLATGVAIDNTSRWLNAITVYASRAQAEQIALLPFVDRLEPVARSWVKSKPVAMTASPETPVPTDEGARAVNYGVSTAQLTQINLPNLHNAGYTGQGVIIGILDTGFRRDHVAFNNPAKPLNVLAEYDFINNDTNTGIQPGDPADQHTHGTLILGCIAAYQPGTVVGGAFDAYFVLCKTEDVTQEVPAEEDDYVAGLEFTELHGADMTTSSLGYIDWYTQAQLNGQTAVTTIAMNIHTANGVHHTNAAGNEYHDNNPATSHLIAPADAFKCLTIGAVDSSGAIASFSSDGPTADGRVKPELLARGISTYTVSTTGTTGTTTADGTSLSTPLAACAVACLIQARPWWTVDAMRQNLFNTADYFVQNGTHDPLFIRGYGIINAFAAYNTCTSVGQVTLDATKYACADVVSINLLDCDLDTDHNVVQSVQIVVSSNSEPTGELVTLTELGPGAGQFTGSVAIGTIDGPTVLVVAPGDTITATYIDADNGQGGQNITVTDTAAVDCTPPVISNVQALNIGPRSATIRFTTNEPARGKVRYGLACGSLTHVAEVTSFSTQPTIVLGDVLDDRTYYYTVEAADEAGNSATDDNGGACYAFTTPDVPDYFTEQFVTGNDLDFHTLEFTRTGPTTYTGCAYPILSLPVDPNGGITLGFTQDDQFKTVNLPSGASIPFFDGSYTRFYVSSNGNITLGTGDSSSVESIAAHFSRRRVSALFDDLSPQTAQSRATYKFLDDRAVVTFWNVPENGTTNSNTFQIELFYDGFIRISYLAIAANDGLAGLSRGAGTPADFYMSDLTALDQCGPRPPLAYDVAVATEVNTNASITLNAIDDGTPNPLSYRITSLPASGRLIDPLGGPIHDVPHVLADFGNVVICDPPTYFQGTVQFTYRADDGGTAPLGGESNEATVAVTVGGPERVYFFPLDTNPGWQAGGQWAFGDPLGQGGNNGGAPDPETGFTGPNVYGVNLAGNYSIAIGGPYTLTTDPLDLSGVTETRLRFRRWLNTDFPPYVRSKIEASADGDTWNTVWEHTGTNIISDSSWRLIELDLSAVDDQPAALVRWSYQIASGAWPYSGWNIDDIEIWGIVQLTPEVCAGDLNCDGTVDFFDIDAFVAALSYPGGIGWPGECPWLGGDCDEDGDVDFFDIDAFVLRLGATCP